MILPSTELPFGELLAALDQQIDLLEAKRSQLADLFDGLIARDEEAVEAVLERIERTERLQTAAESYLSRVRGELARVRRRRTKTQAPGSDRAMAAGTITGPGRPQSANSRAVRFASKATPADGAGAGRVRANQPAAFGKHPA